MSDCYDAFEMSPVPAPGPDAVPPEPFRGIYGMPAFATVPSADLAESVEFWTRGLGFAYVLGQLEAVAAACRALRPGSAGEPRDTPWSTRDVEVITPENVRVVLTAARPFDPDSAEARDLAAVGITPPSGRGDNGGHG